MGQRGVNALVAVSRENSAKGERTNDLLNTDMRCRFLPVVQGILIASFETRGYSLRWQAVASKFGSGIFPSLCLAVQPLTQSSLSESISSTPSPHIDTQVHKETARAINGPGASAA